MVPTIDAGKCAESGQAGHRPGKRRGLPAAVPVVPTIDGGKLTPGKPVIDLATCRGPRGADDRRREADGGQLGKAVIDLASAGAFPRPCPC